MELTIYGGGLGYPLARNSLSFPVSILNLISYTYLHVYKDSCLHVYVVDNSSSVQMNTCDQRTTSNLWNRKVRYDFIFKVQISDSDSHISSGFAVTYFVKS